MVGVISLFFVPDRIMTFWTCWVKEVLHVCTELAAKQMARRWPSRW